MGFYASNNGAAAAFVIDLIQYHVGTQYKRIFGGSLRYIMYNSKPRVPVLQIIGYRVGYETKNKNTWFSFVCITNVATHAEIRATNGMDFEMK